MPEKPYNKGEVGHIKTFDMNKQEYIEQCLRDKKYLILLNGKEVKRIPFMEQAIRFAEKHNGEDLFSLNVCEVIDIQTGAIIYPYF